jgi:hypothetical protein
LQFLKVGQTFDLWLINVNSWAKGTYNRIYLPVECHHQLVIVSASSSQQSPNLGDRQSEDTDEELEGLESWKFK